MKQLWLAMLQTAGNRCVRAVALAHTCDQAGGAADVAEAGLHLLSTCSKTIHVNGASV